MLMGDAQAMQAWGIQAIRAETSYVVDPTLAPYRRIEQRVRISAICPRGHELPYEIVASEEVVKILDKTGGIGFGCTPCGENYQLKIGPWPSDAFPR
jgi:hypothetical protein